MKEFTICTDSCADLSPEMQKELDVKVINMHIVLNNEEYLCAEDEGGLQFRAFTNCCARGQRLLPVRSVRWSSWKCLLRCWRMEKTFYT